MRVFFRIRSLRGLSRSPESHPVNLYRLNSKQSKEPRPTRGLRWGVFFGLMLLGICVHLWPDRPGDLPRDSDETSGAPDQAFAARSGGLGGFFEEPPRGVPLVGRDRLGGGSKPRVAGGESIEPPRSSRAPKGRVVALRQAALGAWSRLREGDAVSLPWFGEEPLMGMTHLRMEDNGWVRFGGALEQERGAFHLNLRGGEVSGAILLPEVETALEIRTEPSGAVLLVERPLSALQCWPAMGAASAEAAGIAGPSDTAQSGVPRINTKPGARGLIYINFEGGALTDPVWNGGRQIVFAPSALSASGILEVIERVAEDYAPFDVAISTNWEDYLAAPVGRRTRIMVTPTSTALPGSGGVAMINAWSAAGQTMSSTVPAWVFTSTPKQVAEGVSHEAGHTLGLNHDGTETPDGRTISSYYKGHGGDLSNPLSWAPIMGEAYTRSQTHWSRGEYAAANNQEDDIAIIRRKINGMGYIDASLAGARPLEIVGGSFGLEGVVHSAEGTVVYIFATSGGNLVASARPKSEKYGNTDLKIEVYDGEGTVWAVSDLASTTSAQVSVALPEGTYSLAVGAGCTGPKPLSGYATGYPTYGAVGVFVLSGTLTHPANYPDLTSPAAAVGIVGEPFVYRPTTTPGAVIAQCVSDAYFGLDWDPARKVVSGTPLREGVYPMKFVVQEGARRVQRELKITVHPDGLPALVSGERKLTPLTNPDSPWRSRVETLPWASAPGSQWAVTASGPVADGGASRLRYMVPAGGVVNFWWKVSSERECDFLECRVNGVVARDRETGELLQVSGVRNWSQQCIQVDGVSVLEFVYRKDFSLSEEQDRGWVAGLEIGRRPVFTRMPDSRRLASGETAFVLAAEVEDASNFQWKKDGVSIADAEVGGRRVSGARSPVLRVEGATAADSGAYVLEARNRLGVQPSRRAEVAVPGAPVVFQSIAEGTGVKTGRSILLSVGVASAKPFFVVWSRNGSPLRWTPSTLLQIPDADASMSGRYSAVVVNAYGSSSAGEVDVKVR